VAVPGSGIDSIAAVAVENVLKGHATGFVYVRVPADLIGHKRFVMSGAPTFRVGERAILFLRPGVTDTAYRPIGLTMGVYAIEADPRTRRAIVQPPVMGGRTAAANGAVARRQAAPGHVGHRVRIAVRLAMATPPGRAVPRGGKR
jgi:hypothetical protein